MKKIEIFKKFNLEDNKTLAITYHGVAKDDFDRESKEHILNNYMNEYKGSYFPNNVSFLRTLFNDCEEKLLCIVYEDKDVSEVVKYDNSKMFLYEKTYKKENEENYKIKYESSRGITIDYIKCNNELFDKFGTKMTRTLSANINYIEELNKIKSRVLTDDSKAIIEIYNLFYNEIPDFSLNDTHLKVQAMMSILSHYGISLEGYTYRPITDSKVPYSVRLGLLTNNLIPHGKIEKIDKPIELNEHSKRIIKIVGNTINSLVNEKQILEDILFPLSSTLYMIDCDYLSLDAVDRITELTNLPKNDVSDCLVLAKKIESKINNQQ